MMKTFDEIAWLLSAGFELVSSPVLSEFDAAPIRKHSTKKPRHALIQKKWDKRFGLKKSRAVVLIGKKILCHPNTYKLIVDANGIRPASWFSLS